MIPLSVAGLAHQSVLFRFFSAAATRYYCRCRRAQKLLADAEDIVFQIATLGSSSSTTLLPPTTGAGFRSRTAATVY